MEKTLNLVKNDPWLEPFAGAITGRHQHVLDKEAELTNMGKQTLSDFASGYLYFGLHRTDKGWTFREWAPNATHIYMVGTFNNWEEDSKHSRFYGNVCFCQSFKESNVFFCVIRCITPDGVKKVIVKVKA